jgi:hypothetical protein
VRLYRDGQAFGAEFDLRAGAVVEQPIAAVDSGHYYQVRGALPSGNLAVSEAVWVPPPAQMLVIGVDAMPWATVRVLDRSSRQPVSTRTYTTPDRLTLAVGDYTFEFTHPDFGTLTRDVTVDESTVEVRVVMPGFDAAATARDLLRPATSRQ